MTDILWFSTIPTLTRMCGVDKRVNELTLRELKELTLADTQEQIPTFQEFLDLVKGTGSSDY